MKKSRYSDSQIMAILKQAEAGSPVPELCREHGMSSATFYKWRSKYGGMDAPILRGAGARHTMALDLQQRTTQYGPWRHNTDTEIGASCLTFHL